MKARLRDIIESNDTFVGRSFDISIQILVIISTIAFTLETLPNLVIEYQNLFETIEFILITIFTIEYLLRLWVARDKKGYLLSFYGIIDAVAILPFYLAVGLDLRALRLVRLLRLLRILKLLRYSQALNRLSLALRLAREELLLFLAGSLGVIYIAAVGIFYFENTVQPENFASIPHAMWWAVSTLTTVGYGDVYPVTIGGKVFTTLILFVGLGLVAMPAGIIASALSKAREIEYEE